MVQVDQVRQATVSHNRDEMVNHHLPEIFERLSVADRLEKAKTIRGSGFELALEEAEIKNCRWHDLQPHVYQPAVLRIHGTLQMRSVRNGQIPDSIALQDILTDEHDIVGTHWAILDEVDRWHPSIRSIRFYHRLIPKGWTDAYEEFIKDPFASLTKCVVDPQFRGLCVSNVMVRARLNLNRTEDCASTVGVAELPSEMRN